MTRQPASGCWTANTIRTRDKAAIGGPTEEIFEVTVTRSPDGSEGYLERSDSSCQPMRGDTSTVCRPVRSSLAVRLAESGAFPFLPPTD
jgi:hypothetical protein